MTDSSILKKLLEEAWDKRRDGNYEEAHQLVDQAHKLCDENNYNILGRIFHVYMQLESDNNKLSKALKLCKQSLAYYKRAENLDRIAHSTRHIADLERQLENDLDSEKNYRLSIDIYKNNANTTKLDLANALRGFAFLLEKLGKTEEAREVWRETKALYLACNLNNGADEANQRLQLLQ